MNDNAEPKVSIIIPHYKTESLVKLCLRSIRFFTQLPYEVVVIDNGSGDDPSLDYLRQVDWIKLIERTGNINPAPDGAHKEAMDIGISESSAPYILSFHTDTIPVHEKWLDWLLEQINTDPKASAVGTYKLEIKSPWQLLFRKIERALMIRRKPEAGTKDNPYYIRSHCALYRRKILEKLNLHFVSNETAGRNIHFGLINSGFEAKLLSVEEMLRYVVHLNHGTMVLQPDLGARKRTIRKGKSRIDTFFKSVSIKNIYQDESLDR
ncbi:hypothetical protein DSCO28_11480 [Desulfosarcina ovata subsp. sediminis]|uniref:Glycosyltransferase 2-like domain-containing protein n=1 Tax=Desulfosarcina ovata subsp. sediminis TaxID=885957 RepID=A0A5K7ZEU5_9BACT|nr:glycosyltransferase [Desulfosarcina ovata]BBO80582.1 hypothetical protein DSCO28_11480 [Desulfosarcina ovata subsp. sediminis]